MTPKVNESKNHTLRAIVAHDLSCFGRCALTVVIPVLAASGVQPVPLPTALMSTHTGGFTGFSMLDTTAEMRAILAHWDTLGLTFDAVYSGFLGSAEQTGIIAGALERFGKHSLKLVDPVLGDDGRLYSTITPELVEGMRGLAYLADLITPNITEAYLLLGGDPAAARGKHTESELFELAKSLSQSFAPSVVITGADTGGGTISTVCYDESGFSLITRPHIGGAFPGTGDLFASVLLCRLLSGASLRDAAGVASDFVRDTIADTMDAGTPPREGVLLERRLHLLSANL